MTARSLLEAVKISCLSTGLKLTRAAEDRLSRGGRDPLTLHEYPTTGGITLELDSNVYVNAPFDEWFCEGARVTIDVDESRYSGLVIRFEGTEIEIVRVLPLPGFVETRDAEGRAVTDVVMTHADRIRLSPFVGCAYDCGFCDLPAIPYQGRPLEQLQAALHVAEQDRSLPPRHVLISGGSPRRAHYEVFEETCAGIVSATSLPVDIMMSPMICNADVIDRLVEAGIHGFAINIELFSGEPADSILGRKYRTTRPVFEEFVSRAVDRLGGNGRVRSLIIPGLEPISETLAGVEYLASLGCDPVLSPFRPAAGTRLDRRPPMSEADLITVLAESRSIASHFDVALGPRCAPCQHNTLTFPWDTDGSS